MNNAASPSGSSKRNALFCHSNNTSIISCMAWQQRHLVTVGALNDLSLLSHQGFSSL